MKERPLIIFTLVSQLAVGTFVLIVLLQAFNIPYPRLALIAVTPLALLGMLASFLHLGKPLNAWRAVFNLRSSWLSREILFAGLFAGLSGLFTCLQWLDWGAVVLRSSLAWLAALAGLALVFSMARVYMLRSLSPWRTWLTLVSFYVTAFLLGILALAAFQAGSIDMAEACWCQSTLPRPAGLFLLGMQLFATIQWAQTQNRPARHLALRVAYQRCRSLPQSLQRLLALRLGLGASGVAIFLLISPSSGESFTVLALWLAFGLALAGEAIGRYLFYSILVE